MSSVDCNAEEINTVNDSASMVPDPYPRCAGPGAYNYREHRSLVTGRRSLTGSRNDGFGGDETGLRPALPTLCCPHQLRVHDQAGPAR